MPLKLLSVQSSSLFTSAGSMSKMTYKLRSCVQAHTSDVRALAIMDTSIITASRDQTIKCWLETSNDYQVLYNVTGHDHFISSVCYVPPDEAEPTGTIVSGGNDKQIVLYDPPTGIVKAKWIAHDNTVCCVTPSIKPGHFLSSSWDGTAKLWNALTRDCVKIYSGHNQAVWAVLHVPEDFILTGSADKKIGVFSIDGQLIKTITGHDDCVRGLSYVRPGVFMSCSNDGTIRKWNINTGELLKLYNCHDNYLYAFHIHKNLLAFGGEGKVLGIMNDTTGERFDLKHPATNIWSIKILPNEDIVTGSSDGYLRLFTKDPSRFASDEVVKKYELQFSENKTAVQDEMPGPSTSKAPITVNELPGKEALKQPGTFDGEIKFVQSEEVNYCYSWNNEKREWIIIGSSNPAITGEPIGPKPRYKNKEYDYVFTVKIDDLGPSLCLPFNKGDDVDMATQKFLVENNLDVKFYQEVKNFIVANTPYVQPTATPTIAWQNEIEEYYPPNDFVFFKAYEEGPMFDKIKEFMRQRGFNEEDISITCLQLKVLLTGVGDNEPGLYKLLEYCLMWPDELVYPLLDVLRVAVTEPSVHSILLSSPNLEKFLLILERFMNPRTDEKNQSLLVRIVANLYSGREGLQVAFNIREKMVAIVFKFFDSYAGDAPKRFEISVATYAINMALQSLKTNDINYGMIGFEFVKKAILRTRTSEPMFRLLVALGTVDSFIGYSIRTEEVNNALREISEWEPTEEFSKKAVVCARKLTKLAK